MRLESEFCDVIGSLWICEMIMSCMMHITCPCESNYKHRYRLARRKSKYKCRNRLARRKSKYKRWWHISYSAYIFSDIGRIFYSLLSYLPLLLSILLSYADSRWICARRHQNCLSSGYNRIGWCTHCSVACKSNWFITIFQIYHVCYQAYAQRIISFHVDGNDSISRAIKLAMKTGHYKNENY